MTSLAPPLKSLSLRLNRLVVLLDAVFEMVSFSVMGDGGLYAITPVVLLDAVFKMVSFSVIGDGGFTQLLLSIDFLFQPFVNICNFIDKHLSILFFCVHVYLVSI